jgi:hypothetical protein
MAVCLTSCLTRRGPPLRAFVRQQIMTRFAKPHTSRRPARRAAGSGAIRSVAEVMAMMVVMAAAAVAGAVVAVAAVATTAVPAAMAAAAACVGGGGDGGDGSPQPPPIHQWALGAGAARGSPWRPLTLKLVWRRCDRPPRAADVPVAPHAAATSDAVMLAGRLPGEMASPWAPWQRDGILRSKVAFPISQKTSSTTLSTNTGPFLVWVGGGNKRQTAPRQGESSKSLKDRDSDRTTQTCCTPA